ncbi:MAG: cytochrome biosis protein [Thermomicrobiales bacterium]|jgi:ABC-type sugar transport system permease subunit|nr:cytochrome biosis protein [Thermomicrobiales bacterium]MCD6057460.1 cytochrome biosis protein [Thermomicrobiales bacterium]MDF3016151.1 cytochrome biosis protein [Thermomicrobiales bacterium]
MALALPTLARRETARPLDRWWRRAAPYVFVSPFYLIFLAFGLLPIVFSLGVSLYDWRGTTPGAYVGATNYQLLLHDPAFYTALRNTVFVWLGSVPPMILLALVFAVLLNSQLVRFRGFFRTVYFLPVVTSLVITGLIFKFLFNPSFGLVNRLLEPLGIAPGNMLADPTWMKPVLILALLWRWTGNDMVIMLAGLQSIPGDLYEAARVDGASGPQMFWHITVPLMRPVILFDAIISTIGTFNLFAEPFVLFGQDGGIGQAGMVTGTLLYLNSFVYFKFGYGAALAWVLALIIFVLSMMQLKLGSREAD